MPMQQYTDTQPYILFCTYPNGQHRHEPKRTRKRGADGAAQKVQKCIHIYTIQQQNHIL